MTDSISWLDEAKKLLEYRRDAAEFLERAAQQLPVSPADAGTVSELWHEAEQLDTMICTLLGEMNDVLLAGGGELDTTRGASPAGSPADADGVVYECSWTLDWGDGLGVLVKLSTEPRHSAFNLVVRAGRASEERPVPYPVAEEGLKLALAHTYAAEASAGRLRATP